MKKEILYLLGFLFVSLFPFVTFADYTISTGSDGAYGDSWGYSSGVAEYVGQPFTTIGAGSVDTIDVKTQYQGSPGDHAYLEIQSDTGGSPSGAVLGTSDNFDPTAPPGSVISVNFSSPVVLSAGTVYWFVFKRTGGNSIVDYYDVRVGAGMGTDCKVYYSSAWNSCYGSNPVYANVYVVEGGGGGGGSATSTTASTTIISNPSQNLFNGFIIFFISMILPLWFFRKPLT